MSHFLGTSGPNITSQELWYHEFTVSCTDRREKTADVGRENKERARQILENRKEVKEGLRLSNVSRRMLTYE